MTTSCPPWTLGSTRSHRDHRVTSNLENTTSGPPTCCKWSKWSRGVRMSNSTRRLERVGTVVNPTQLFRMWMEEVHQYHALGDYTRSLVGKPDGAYPLVRLPALMRAAVHQEMKGQAQEAVARAVNTAQRDVIFLFHLFMNANKNLIEVRRGNWLELTLLCVMDTHAGPDQAPSFGREPWAEAATRFLLHVYGEAGAVDYLQHAVLRWAEPPLSRPGRGL